MAAPKFKIVANINGAAAKLKALQAAGENMTPAYAAVGSVVANRVRLCFKLGLDPWGSPWKPIKWRAVRRTDDGTRASKAGRAQRSANAAGKAGQPLRDTGTLQRSITSKPDRTGVSVGTSKLQARAHQFGATIVPKKAKFLVFPGPNGELIFAKKAVIPARPFLPIKGQGAPVVLPAAWSNAVVRALKAHFLKAVEKATA